MTTRILMAIMCVVCATISAYGQTPVAVSYLSADHVYLSGGRAEGLQLGQQVIVLREGKVVATLEVVYLADHSASCTIVESKGAIQTGDLVDIPIPASGDSAATSTTATDSTAVVPPKVESTPAPVSARTTPRPDIWGSLAIGALGWRDKDSDDRDYTQSNVRLNLRTRHLMNDRLTLSLRSRGRYDERNRTYRSAADSRVWLNRLYEMSAAYQSEDKHWRASFGRMPIRSVAALGVLDGLVVERDLSGSFSLGAFGGLQPQWQYSEGRASLSRFGIMSEFRQTFGEVSWKSSAALLREYHSGEINRDALMLQSYAGSRDRWQASLLAEFDYNSGWRKVRSGSTFTLSSVYAYLRYRVIEGLSINTNYGSRQTVWLWDYRDIADTLLDERTRRWSRVGIDLSPSTRWALGGTVGAYFQDARSRRQLSSTVYGRLNRLWDPRSTFWSQYTMSEGIGERAHTYSVRITQGFRRLDQFSVAFGENSYKVTDADRRSSWWAEGELQNELVDRVMLRLRYRHAAGDDLRGSQFETELGYRF